MWCFYRLNDICLELAIGIGLDLDFQWKINTYTQAEALYLLTISRHIKIIVNINRARNRMARCLHVFRERSKTLRIKFNEVSSWTRSITNSGAGSMGLNSACAFLFSNSSILNLTRDMKLYKSLYSFIWRWLRSLEIFIGSAGIETRYGWLRRSGLSTVISFETIRGLIKFEE